MSDPIRVEIVPCTVDADEQTQARRADAVARLTNLGHLDAADGQLNTQTSAGWTATVNGTAMPVIDFAVQPDDAGGQALVSLVVAADMVSVGRSPASVPAPATVPVSPDRTAEVTAPVGTSSRGPRSTWGGAGKRDPRASIPGWEPAVSGSEANA